MKIRAGYTDVVYDGVRLSDYMVIESVAWAMRPEKLNETERVAGRDGAILKSSSYAPLYVTMNVRVFTDKMTYAGVCRAVSEIGSIVSKTSLRKLSLYPGKYVYAILDGQSDIEKILHTGACELVFLCPDPIAYGEHRKATVTLADIKATDGTITLNVAGSEVTRPKITLNYSNALVEESLFVGNPIEWKYWSDLNVHVTQYTGSTRIFIIDCVMRSIKCDGGQSDPAMIGRGVMNLDSDYPAFVRGENTITFYNYLDAGYPLKTAVIEWDERCFL